MTVLTGVVGSIAVGETTITGTGLTAMEGTLTIGRERATFQPVGTDVTERLTGLKTVEGTVRKAWVSGDSTFQDLIDNDTDFAVAFTSTSSDQSITASGCRVSTISRRMAPGTEVMVEELTYSGRDWY